MTIPRRKVRRFLGLFILLFAAGFWRGYKRHQQIANNLGGSPWGAS